jgi:2-C-methyl-D-erythritol 4-phosphate cytidylyltransferase
VIVPRWCAIIVAAGRGQRFGRPKQLIELAGKPMVAWSLETFGTISEVSHIVIATEPEYLNRMQQLATAHAPRAICTVTLGGETRQASVRAALDCVPERCEGVFVHDGARPLVRALDVRAGMRAVRPGIGALLAAPVVDTIKVVAPGTQRVTQTLDRATLWAAQTPQFAFTRDLRAAHAQALRDDVEVTDDAALLERSGFEVTVVPSSEENFKVTHAFDRDRAEVLLRARMVTEPTSA